MTTFCTDGVALSERRAIEATLITVSSSESTKQGCAIAAATNEVSHGGRVAACNPSLHKDMPSHEPQGRLQPLVK